MIDWASSDVDRLFELATKQLDCISSEVREARAVRESNEFVKFARDMDVESQRAGIEVYLWPVDEGALLEIFILPYMEHLNRPEIIHVTETREEEITDWFLCEQIWEHIEPKLTAKFDAEPIHRRA